MKLLWQIHEIWLPNFSANVSRLKLLNFCQHQTCCDYIQKTPVSDCHLSQLHSYDVTLH